jgi:hypothetical protein
LILFPIFQVFSVDQLIRIRVNMIAFLSLLTTSFALLTTVCALPSFSSGVVERQSDTACGTATNVGILEPKDGTNFSFDSSGPANISILYCSGQYFKTSTIDASVWLAPRTAYSLSAPNSAYGQLMVKNAEPDNQDVPAGYYSYRLNATVYPGSQSFMDGDLVLSVYEQTTGMSNDLSGQHPRWLTYAVPCQVITMRTTLKYGVSTLRSLQIRANPVNLDPTIPHTVAIRLTGHLTIFNEPNSQ